MADACSSATIVKLAICLMLLPFLMISECEMSLVVKQPATNKTKPLVVGVQIIIDDVSSVRAIDQDFRLDYYLILNWTIEGATCMQDIEKLARAKGAAFVPNVGDQLILSGEEMKFFWTPDPFPVDVKKVESPNTQPLLRVKIMQEADERWGDADGAGEIPFSQKPHHDYGGDVAIFNNSSPQGFISGSNRRFCSFRYESRLAAIVACQMNFRLAPVDQQFCVFRYRSYAYPMPFVKLEWSGEGVKRGRDKDLTLNHYLTYMTWDHLEIVPQWSISNYSTLRLMFRFDRLVSNFVVVTIGPTILILGVSYSSFWIGVDTGPGRFIMTVLTLLSIVTQYASVRSTSMPPVSYVSAADVWFLVCMVFIFVAIIELAIVNYLEKKRKIKLAARGKKQDTAVNHEVAATPVRLTGVPSGPRLNRNKDTNSNIGPVMIGSWSYSPADHEAEIGRLRSGSAELKSLPIKIKNPYEITAKGEPEDHAIRIDIIMRIAYPCLFLLFNLIYWPFLYSLRSDTDSEQLL